MEYGSFGELAREFEEMAKKAPKASEQAVYHGAVNIAASIRKKFGKYQDGWPMLAKRTRQERSRLGFTSNDPLLRSGQLRDSIQPHAEQGTPEEARAFIGVEAGDVTLKSAQGRSVDAALVMAVHTMGNETVPKRDPFGAIVGEDLDRHTEAIVDETLGAIGLTPAARPVTPSHL